MKKKYLLLGAAMFFTLSIFCFAKASLAGWKDITGSLGGYRVESLVQGSDGLIYAGGIYNNGLANRARVWRYENNAWTDFTGNLDGDEIYSLALGPDGLIYAGGSSSYGVAAVWRYYGGVWVDITGGLTGYNVDPLVFGPDGLLYVGESAAKVWRYSGGVWTDITDSNLSGNIIISIVFGADGLLYAGGNVRVPDTDSNLAKVWRYSGSAWSDITGELSGYSVYSLLSGFDGHIYAGGQGLDNAAKLWQYDGSSWLDKTGSLFGYIVYDLINSNNSVYAGIYGAKAMVEKYSNDSWEDKTGSLSGYAVYSLLQTADGALYAGGTMLSDTYYAKVWKYDLSRQEDELINGEKVIVDEYLDHQTISGQDLSIYFKKLPTKLTKNSKYWMKFKKQSGYPSKTFLANWKLTTNLYKYKARKSSQKFKITVTFNYTKRSLNKFLKKNKKATKSNLFLKYQQGKSSWKPLASIFTDAKVIKKNKKFIVKYFTNFPVKAQYFAIGVK